ncbi:hypothetical protein BJF83_24695 [Nocardiopsis sp. CNR-923]|uniref:hypothetical protein n=1 Tax=Nocardiopsis sp. CNR-923 TaxID=1904965 RepID=UPI00095CDFAD|nr:hypothetical protein [Nocardiopsis sp. CNR-923]OLT30542.1 hypothetical protein BJF83_24695 [Nocardiopsis sp. CNR-923]
MSVPMPDVSTPEGRFITAYGSWQHARMTAGLAMLTAPPPQALTLAANMVHWTIEFDQTWEHLEGAPYTTARDAHPARGVLSALRVVRERVGVVCALELGEDGPLWRPAQDLGLGPVDREVYAEHLGGRGLFDTETTVLDLLINGEAVADGRGRQVLEEVSLMWQAGDEAPHEMDPETRQAMDESLDEFGMFSTHTPEEIEAYHAERGGYFLTLEVGDDKEHHTAGAVDGPLGAWYALMRQVGGTSYRALAMGTVYLFKGEYARNTVRELAQVARALNPGHWEVVEGYRPPPEEQQTDPQES